MARNICDVKNLAKDSHIQMNWFIIIPTNCHIINKEKLWSMIFFVSVAHDSTEIKLNVVKSKDLPKYI